MAESWLRPQAALGVSCISWLSSCLMILIAAGFFIACAAGGYFVGLKVWDYNEAEFLAGDQSVNPSAPNPDATSQSN